MRLENFWWWFRNIFSFFIEQILNCYRRLGKQAYMYKRPPSGLLERVNGPFFCRENVKWIFLGVKTWNKIHAWAWNWKFWCVNSWILDLCVNVKLDDITKIYNLQVSFHLSNQCRSHRGSWAPQKDHGLFSTTMVGLP